jgi:hypothetical protein
MLLGQVHAFRRRRSAGLSQPGDYELLLARLTVFDEWARSVSDFTEDNLDLIGVCRSSYSMPFEPKAWRGHFSDRYLRVG